MNQSDPSPFHSHRSACKPNTTATIQNVLVEFNNLHCNPNYVPCVQCHRKCQFTFDPKYTKPNKSRSNKRAVHIFCIKCKLNGIGLESCVCLARARAIMETCFFRKNFLTRNSVCTKLCDSSDDD